LTTSSTVTGNGRSRDDQLAAVAETAVFAESCEKRSR
jgi:hypothetical protein